MTLFRQGDFDAHVQSLAGTTLSDQWGSRVAKVGDKVFAVLNIDGDATRISLKCTEDSFEILTALDGIEQAPYFAKRKWLAISSSADLPADDLRYYFQRSYDLVAAGLTKKLRAQLKITPSS